MRINVKLGMRSGLRLYLSSCKANHFRLNYSNIFITQTGNEISVHSLSATKPWPSNKTKYCFNRGSTLNWVNHLTFAAVRIQILFLEYERFKTNVHFIGKALNYINVFDFFHVFFFNVRLLEKGDEAFVYSLLATKRLYM